MSYAIWWDMHMHAYFLTWEDCAISASQILWQNAMAKRPGGSIVDSLTL